VARKVFTHQMLATHCYSQFYIVQYYILNTKNANKTEKKEKKEEKNKTKKQRNKKKNLVHSHKK